MRQTAVTLAEAAIDATGRQLRQGLKDGQVLVSLLVSGRCRRQNDHNLGQVQIGEESARNELGKRMPCNVIVVGSPRSGPGELEVSEDATQECGDHLKKKGNRLHPKNVLIAYGQGLCGQCRFEEKFITLENMPIQSVVGEHGRSEWTHSTITSGPPSPLKKGRETSRRLVLQDRAHERVIESNLKGRRGNNNVRQ